MPDGIHETLEEHTLIAKKVSGIPGVSWTCVIVDDQIHKIHNEDEFSIDSAFNRLYALLFFLTFLMFLLAFSYKRQFKATELKVGECQDVDVNVRMQKVLVALFATSNRRV